MRFAYGVAKLFNMGKFTLLNTTLTQTVTIGVINYPLKVLRDQIIATVFTLSYNLWTTFKTLQDEVKSNTPLTPYAKQVSPTFQVRQDKMNHSSNNWVKLNVEL